MERTPKISRSIKHFCTTNETQRTPVLESKMYSELDNDESPVYIASTQEGCDNVDVVWDWNSPQAKQPRKSKKRLILSQSPKVFRRHPSNNNDQNFEKVREGLRSLWDAIALPDNEDSLVLSPVEEAKYKSEHEENINDIPPSTQDIYLGGNEDDWFNDSADEELLLCTQKIEADLENMKKNDKLHSNNLVNNLNEDNLHRFASTNSTFQSTNNLKTEAIKENDIVDNIISNNKLEQNYLKFNNRTKSLNHIQYSKQVGKVEFHRTQSFESTVECSKEGIPRYKLNEIEKRRKEARAKLESKRKEENNLSWKCSPEEIEQKRLQALAKLEAKRLQETIERKRQDALKRRELSRQKNAVVVKSSLSKRL